MTTRLRIGITQRVEVVAGRNERRDALDQRWAVLVDGLGHVPIPLANMVSDASGYLDALGLDAAVMTGGNDLASTPGARDGAPERDRLERALIEHMRQSKHPLLAVCRGLQMLNVALGGTLSAIEGHAGRDHQLSYSKFSGIDQVNSFHDWAISVEDLASDLIPLAAAPGGTVEAARHCDLPWVGVMWHPERPISNAEVQRSLVDMVLKGRSLELIAE
jgi:N5-(cytidine 5'-diphosphoramidyl)-L-glutamine hydrolase